MNNHNIYFRQEGRKILCGYPLFSEATQPAKPYNLTRAFSIEGSILEYPILLADSEILDQNARTRIFPADLFSVMGTVYFLYM